MDIERLATSAVVESISLTDVLSPFINDGDKEPSWDGNIYIYADKHKSKKGIKKVPVQIKGETRKRLPTKRAPKYSVSMIDLDNWLNDGGIVLFVVLMDENGQRKIIYYCSLLPVKIRSLKSIAHGKGKISVPLIAFPEDNNQKVSTLLNFYNHRQKQSSFANAPLYSIEELEKNGVLENISFSVTAYGTGNGNDAMESALLQNEVYMYANIKGASIPQPLPDIPTNLHIAKEIQGDVSVKNLVFYHSYRVVRSLEGSVVHIGKSMIFKLSPDMKTATITFKLKGTLSDYIRDTECIIAILENKELCINGNPFPLEETEKIGTEQYRKRLAYFRDVKKMLDLLGVSKELDCSGMSDQDENNLRNFTNAMVYDHRIGFSDSTSTMLYGRFKIANLIILIWADRDSDNGYKLQSYFNDHRIALFENSDKKMEHPHPITHYVLLKKDDFIDAANVNYKMIREDLLQNEASPLVTEQITLFLLEMLKAYDEMKDKDAELLSTAETYCDWLIEKTNALDDMMTLNRLQIIKRKREFTQEEISLLQELRKKSNQRSVQCAASILLEKQELAQTYFDEMDASEKQRFLCFPICNLGKLVN